MVSEKLLLTSYVDKHHHHKQLTPFSYELPAIYKSSVIILVCFFPWSIWIKDVIWLDLANMSSNLFFSWLIWIETLLKMRSDRILDIQIRHPIYSLYHQWINNGRSIVVVVVVGWKWLFSFVKSVSEHFIWIETLLKMWSFWILDCANPSSNRASLSSVDKQWATQRWLYLFEKTMQIAFYWSSKDMNNVNVAFLASFLQTLGNHDDMSDISIDYSTRKWLKCATGSANI